MASVLKRLTRPLPRSFRRPVQPTTRALVARRHQRRKRLSQEWRSRQWRRLQRMLGDAAAIARRWLAWVVAGFATLFVAIVFFFPVFDVREIKIERRDPRIDVETVQQSLAPLFHRRLFFLGERDIVQPLREVMPDLTAVRIRKEYAARRLTVALELQPLLWRLQIEQPPGGRPSDTASATGAVALIAPRRTTQDLITAQGVYVTAPPSTATAALPSLRVVDWGVRPMPGTILLPPASIARAQEAEAALRERFGITLRGREFHLRAREFHLQAGTVSLWFDLQSPLADQLERYALFLASGTAAREYVDLRLSGRVVYR